MCRRQLDSGKPVAWFSSRDEAAARYLRISGLAGLLGTVRAGFDRALADPVDPAIGSAEIASGLRPGRQLRPGHRRLLPPPRTWPTRWPLRGTSSVAPPATAGSVVAAAVAEVQPELPVT